MTTSSSWPRENPAWAPSFVHRSVRTTPMSTTTALPSHGTSFCRSQPASRVIRPVCAAALLPLAAFPSAVHLASPVWTYRATAATAATRPASAAGDQDGFPPKPRKWVIVPSDPVLRVSHEISGGTASIAMARPAVTAAAPPTQAARLAPRSGPSGRSDPSSGGRRPTPPGTGASVSHQNRNSASVITATIAGGSHQPSPVTAADAACGPDGTSTSCQRSSQPQAWASAYSGASATTNVTIAPSSSDRTPVSIVAALGAM